MSEWETLRHAIHTRQTQTYKQTDMHTYTCINGILKTLWPALNVDALCPSIPHHEEYHDHCDCYRETDD